MLLELTEDTVLENLIQRYNGDEPYTYTGEILTSVNPCKAMPGLYSAETMTSYAGRLLGGSRPPHLYAIAEETYRMLVKERSHQGLVVSGVSGAGKTEANKIVTQYLCWRASHSAGQLGRHMILSDAAIAAAKQMESGGYDGLDELPRRILNSNVVFEAFGNASTTNNDNSSRFGKFVRLLFDQAGCVRGARVSTYLLEKSRLVLQCKEERNFHVLYQLLAGSASDGTDCAALHLEGPEAFSYLSQSGRIAIDGVDDAAEWNGTLVALRALGISEEDLMQACSPAPSPPLTSPPLTPPSPLPSVPPPLRASSPPCLLPSVPTPLRCA